MNKIWLNPVPVVTQLMVFLGLLCAAPLPLLAQDWTDGYASDDAGHPKPEQIQARLTALDDDVNIEPQLKEALITTYREALDEQLIAELYRDRAEAFSVAIDSAPSTMREQEIADDEPAYADNISGPLKKVSTEQLRRDLTQQRVYLSRLDGELANVVAELKRIEARPLAISSRLPMAQAELIELRSTWAALKQTDAGASPELTAERTLQQARESRLVSEVRMLELEQLSQGVREELLRGEQGWLARRIDNASAGLERLQVKLRHGLTREAMRLNWLRKIPLPVVNGDGAERGLIEEVQGFAAEFERVVQNLEQADRSRDQMAMHRKVLDADFSAIKEELVLAGGGIGMTQVLLDLHRRLPEKHRDVRMLIKALPSVDDARLASLRTKAALAEQASVARRFADHSAPVLATVVEARDDVLEELVRQYGHLIHALAELEAERERFLLALDQIDEYVSEQLFGFGSRDSPSFAVDSLAELPEELRWYVQRAHWLEIGEAVLRSMQNTPLRSFALLVFLGLLAWKRRWLWQAIEHAGHDLRRFSTDRYARTLEVLLWTLLLAAPWPLAISYVAWALDQTLYPSQWAHGMILGLYLAAVVAFTLRFLSLMCRPGGLAEAHFGWRGNSLAKFRRLAKQLLMAYLPSLLLVYGGLYEGGSEYLFNTGCAVFMFCHLLIAGIFWYMVSAEQGWLAALMDDQPDRLVMRWRYLWIPLVVGMPVAVAILAGTGYLITAIQTSRSLTSMGTIVAAAIVGYGLAVRWFRIRQRRLALVRRLARDNKAQQGSAVDLELGIEIEDSELDLGTISEQTLRLLRVLFTLAAAFSVLLYWSEAVPLIGILETVSLPGFERLTLADMVWVVLTAVLTYSAVLNLPGLMALTILNSGQVQSGTRHAVVTLCQYTLTVIGLSAMFKLLQMDWAMFGWIVAALGVGIGFGLQEIVANFVCGIILLFERPIRVGDRVTIDGVVGTVTHIQLRATIITNFDRQDFVVPNKRLITKSLLNWTLSGDLNRISVPVSVSPGIDMESARRILFEAATAHPGVLEDPEPIAVFESFSGGLRNFMLYAFLPELQYRLQVISELHTDIERRFGAAGIEIALPQTQLNLTADASTVPPASMRGKRE